MTVPTADPHAAGAPVLASSPLARWARSRLLLAGLLPIALSVLAACSDGADTERSYASGSPAGEPDSDGTGGTNGTSGTGGAGERGAGGQEVEHTVVEIVTRAAAGGQVTRTPTPIGDRLSLLRYGATFHAAGGGGGELADEIAAVAADHPLAAGSVLTATVVRVGCAAPDAVTVVQVDGRVEVSAEPEPRGAACEGSPAAQTSVALVEVPKDLLPTRPDPERTAVTPGPR